ncbi:MAG: DUF2490 domain-containing protein [Myxococcales bacterium]|nr:DUF2490 domain-containing protein [Myxococcales bacterium]
MNRLPLTSRLLLVCLGSLAIWALGPSQALAQSDSGLWLSGGLRIRLSDELRLDAGAQLRLDSDWGRVASVFPEVGLSYEISETLRLGIGYRLVLRRLRPNGDFGPAQRLHVDARFKWKIEKIFLSYRLRLQEGLQHRTSGLALRHMIRNLVGVAYDTDMELTPFASMELYNRLGGGPGFSFDRWRITIGVKLELEPHSFEIFYRAQIPIADYGQDPTEHILGLGYTYELDDRKPRGRRPRDRGDDRDAGLDRGY